MSYADHSGYWPDGSHPARFNEDDNYEQRYVEKTQPPLASGVRRADRLSGDNDGGDAVVRNPPLP